jgi:UDP-N-acetylglucosamine acyltransferase
MVHPAAFVDEGAQLGTGVTIGPGAVIGPHVRVGDGTDVGSHALLTGWTTIGRECRIHHGAVIGSPPQDLKFGGEKTFLEMGDHTVGSSKRSAMPSSSASRLGNVQMP